MRLPILTVCQNTHPTPVEPATCLRMAKERVVAGVHASCVYIPSWYRTASHSFDFWLTGLIGLSHAQPDYYHRQAMFSDAPHHRSVYGYYDELVEAEKPSYQDTQTTIATAHWVQEELKELHQETASLTLHYWFSVIGDTFLCQYSTNAKVSTTAPHSIRYCPPQCRK
ncbi:uncharacterized protein BT62DRAFT_1075644 [Guyanagaster necrorhizus]|uniref:Uncharacterized protein n=1 Tax=Guyanagaster necrorhizus TaxID=856835 RepID=A0A9P8AT74_9AGAR|nr:uncharacterized protein BT62DRAFT_1075644 [Guyanagaster necrorhizus MCA 3950]KAG7446900.1 hypothetical protein BT62DRAFT_1075644 [Guyanagaster necrorhizus MCA 3950]